MQMRGFRRTAILRPAEAGISIPRIAAVSGHSIQRTQAILQTYLPRAPELAKEAILALERAEEGLKNAEPDSTSLNGPKTPESNRLDF